MKQSLLQGLDPDEVSSFKEETIKATLYRKGLKKVLERKIKSLQEQMENPKYENPNWINQQTDHIGHIKALKQVISLIE